MARTQCHVVSLVIKNCRQLNDKRSCRLTILFLILMYSPKMINNYGQLKKTKMQSS